MADHDAERCVDRECEEEHRCVRCGDTTDTCAPDPFIIRGRTALGWVCRDCRYECYD